MNTVSIHEGTELREYSTAMQVFDDWDIELSDYELSRIKQWDTYEDGYTYKYVVVSYRFDKPIVIGMEDEVAGAVTSLEEMKNLIVEYMEKYGS